MVLNASVNKISVISWWEAEYPEKTTDLSQVTTDKLDHINVALPGVGTSITCGGG